MHAYLTLHIICASINCMYFVCAGYCRVNTYCKEGRGGGRGGGDDFPSVFFVGCGTYRTARKLN